VRMGDSIEVAGATLQLSADGAEAREFG
jgi:hypothetical protein